MPWWSQSKAARRTELIILRRLLASADEALSVDGLHIHRALERIATAFEYFRTQHRDTEHGSALVDAPEPERAALRQLATGPW